MQGEFTGRKMLGVMVGAFAVIVAVNLTMASYATSGFSGVVVKNSYVASQKFNGWLDAADRQSELGWDASIEKIDGRIRVRTAGVPDTAEVIAELRRPLGEQDIRHVAFGYGAEGVFVSRELVPGGRWIARVTIADGADLWRQEMRIE